MKKQEILNPEEKLNLIKNLIEESKENFEKGSGRVFIMWGYLSLIITLVVLLLVNVYHIYWAPKLFFLILIIGMPWMLIFLRKKEKVITFADKFISVIWIVTGLVCALFPLLSFIDVSISKMIPAVEAMVVSMGAMMTGLTIKSKPVAIGGFIALILSLSMYIKSDFYIMMYTFLAVFIFGLIIPGHILNYQTRNK